MKQTSSQDTLWMLGVRRENRAGKLLKNMAGTTGLEPAASAVTGQRLLLASAPILQAAA